jgi:hypothetical protein
MKGMRSHRTVVIGAEFTLLFRRKRSQLMREKILKSIKINLTLHT